MTPLLGVQRPTHQFVVKGGVGETKQVHGGAGVLSASHGGDVLHTYATWGAGYRSKAAGDCYVAHAFPSQFYTISMVDMEKMDAILTIKQFVAMVLLPILLGHGCVENAVVGGWSLGSLFTFHSAMELEACMAGPRAAFVLDATRLPPVGRLLGPVKLRVLSPDIQTEGSFSNRAFANFDCAEVPHFRFGAPSLHFTCPHLQHD